MNNFAFFIASYGKPENIMTLNSLTRLHTQYPIYIVVGDDDPELDKYKELYPSNLLVFTKSKYRNQIDCLGIYATYDKICTYSRLAVQEFAETLGIKYIGYLFDDIQRFRLRYKDGDKVRGISDFNIDVLIDMYIELLNSSPDIYIVGPPQSSFYIGINPTSADTYTARYGNFFIYDRDKELEPFKASILEDMSIVLYNNMRGKLSICPFGLQVMCRRPAITKDSYGSMSTLEYYEHLSIIDGGQTVNMDSPSIRYKNYLPKIVADIKDVPVKKNRRLF